MFSFECHRYSSVKKFAFIKVFDQDQLIAIVREPPEQTVFGPMIGERDDHWRIDCDRRSNFQALKNAVSNYLSTNKISVFGSDNWQWLDKSNTEVF